MKDNFFLDTNIFIYSFDKTSPEKKNSAQDLIKQALKDGNGFISYQVIQEFINVALLKFKIPFTPDDCKIYLEQVLTPLCKLYPDSDFYLYALTIKEITKYSFYDSLIIAAAKKCKCTVLYSEDMQDGFQYEDLIIKNPFK